MNADMPGLAVNRVSVTYRNGHTALRDATFSVPHGSIAALGASTVRENRRCLKR